MKDLRKAVLCLVTLLCAITAFGQSYLDEPGIPEFTTSFPVEHGFINIANGNLHLEIPIASYPQRGSRFKYQARLVYDSRFWVDTPTTDTQPGGWLPNGVNGGPGLFGVGWRLVTSSDIGTEDNDVSTKQCACTLTMDNGNCLQWAYVTTFSNFNYQSSDGTNHRTGKLFKVQNACGGTTLSGSAFASDNSGYKFVISGQVGSNSITVYAPDGTQVSPAIQDTNGNFLTESIQQVEHVIDTVGREPVISSFSGSPVNQVFLDYLNPQGTRSRATVNLVPISLATQFGNGGDYTGTASAVQNIVFPDGSSYQFGYDSYGQITSMTLPTGGQVTYGYTNTTPPNQINRWLTSRTAGGNTWTFNPAINCTTASCTAPGDGLKVTVTTPPHSDGTLTASDNHVYSFVFASANGGGGAWLTQAQYFRGSASGTPLLTLTKEYNNGTNNSCQGPMGSSLVPVLVRETLTWPSSAISKKVEYCYDSNGINVISKKMWDYQQNGNFAAAPDREVDTTYVTDPAYVNANILTLPLSVTNLGPGGTQVAKTTYAYDGGTPQPSNITTQHTTPTSPRGNLTSVSKWLNTTNSNIISSTAWFDTGEIYQSTDPLGHTATFSYDPAFAGAYPTQTCNALSQCSYQNYDFNTGSLISATDINGNSAGDPTHTTTYTYDSMLRPLCTNAPDGGQSCTSYPSATTTTRTTKITSALSDVSSVLLDSLGRLSETQHITPAGTAKVDTTYDPLGRVSSVSNPYFATTDPTYGISQTTYDGLGRGINTTRQDGSIATAQFSVVSGTVNGTCVTNTDEAGKQRRLCHNGFGELIEVDEPGDSFAGTNAAGTLAVNGSLQSQSGVGATNPTSGTGSVTITGAENSITTDPCADQTPPIGAPPATCPQTLWDSGTVTITVNGHSDSSNYGSNSTTASVASGLASAINGDTASFVNASAANGVLTLTARGTGAATNYSWNLTSSSSDPTDFGTAGSFSSTPLSGTLGGGSNGSGGTTVYDAGTVTVSIGTFQASVSYGQTTNNTTSAVASALAIGLNAGSSPVTASASGPNLTITYKTVGTAGNVSVNCSSSTSQTAYFTGPSFSCAGITLSNGLNPEGPSLDFNYFVTQYSYDALGNLINVTQKGDPGVSPSSQWRVRNFTYDSLSRLLTANNPESGQISYSFDVDGNLLQKTSPAANQTGTATQTISYCYDQLHRVTGKAYSAQTCQGTQLPAGTAVVSYTYDQGANGIGRMTHLSHQAGSGTYTYDNMGRIATEQRIISGITKNMSYTYQINGSIKTITYPSNATITYAPWNNGTATVSSLQEAKDLGNNINYVTSATYQADGQITGFVSGNSGTFSGITNSFSYNKRLQPVAMSAASPSQTVLSLSYDFHIGNGDNGDVYGITNNRDATRNQAFTYDSLNRLISAQNAGTDCTATVLGNKTKFWGNSYSYDAWGNLYQKNVTKCSAEHLNVTVDVSNRLHATGTDYQYDAAGNMTADPTDNLSTTYDAENRIATETQNGVTTTYTYNDEGNRVQKVSGGTGTLYWYMLPGIVAESDLTGNLKSEYVFFNGLRVTRKDFPGNSIAYYFSDHLKSSSVITDSAGNIKAESDYYPWGGELQFVNNDSNHYKFTGKERDLESGLDYFGARYYSNGIARWISADWRATPVPVPYADLTDPQTLNLFGYVRGLPTTKTDFDGHGFFTKLKNLFTDGGWNEDAEAEQERNRRQHQRAEQARAEIRKMRNLRLNGMSPQDFADKATDKQILDAQRALVEFFAAQALNPCPPGVSCGVVFPTGAMGEAGAGGVSFGHGARHLTGTGLTEKEVEAAITQDVKGALANATETGGGFWGRVTVNGQVIEYRAFPLLDGTIHVGTYYVP